MWMRGQAALEMTAALIGVLLLLFGSLKVCLWLAERLIARQQSYEATRVGHGAGGGGSLTEPSKALRIFE